MFPSFLVNTYAFSSLHKFLIGLKSGHRLNGFKTFGIIIHESFLCQISHMFWITVLLENSLMFQSKFFSQIVILISNLNILFLMIWTTLTWLKKNPRGIMLLPLYLSCFPLKASILFCLLIKELMTKSLNLFQDGF